MSNEQIITNNATLPVDVPSGDPASDRRYVVLLPLLDLEESLRLMPLASSIAAHHNGEVVVLGVVVVPEEQSLADGVLRARDYRAEIYRAFDAAPTTTVPVSFAVRVDHSIDSAVRNTIAEGGGHLILLGWQESETSPERLFGPPIDTLLRVPPCDTVVVKLGNLADCRRNTAYRCAVVRIRHWRASSHWRSPRARMLRSRCCTPTTRARSITCLPGLAWKTCAICHAYNAGSNALFLCSRRSWQSRSTIRRSY